MCVTVYWVQDQALVANEMPMDMKKPVYNNNYYYSKC